jgi:uncharacterized membrane protein YdcZ (DUF606 family)
VSTEATRRKWAGAPWWAAGLGATAVVAAGAALGDGYFAAAIVTGCVLAALVADRKAFFTVLAQPPLITATVGAAAVLLGKPLLTTAVDLSTTFPYLAATMVAVATIVTIRHRQTP